MNGRLDAGEKISTIVIAWYFPNVDYSFGATPDLTPGGRITHLNGPMHKSVQLRFAKLPELKKRTQTFHDALFATTLPAYVLEAVSANLAYPNRRLSYANTTEICGLEGCHLDRGSCPVMYTCLELRQSLAHLFLPWSELTRAGVTALDGRPWSY